MSKPWVCGVIVVLLVFASTRSSVADDIEFFPPDNSASGRPILEFRARPPKIDLSDTKKNTPGHGFVFLGIELNNGSTRFFRAGGFYPKEGSNIKAAIVNAILSPGHVDYKYPLDLKDEQVFRVRITQRQADQVNYILDNWDTKTYSIAWQNCVSLERDIARSIGLAVPEFNPADINLEIPTNFVSVLRAANLSDAPLKFDELETKRMDAVRNQRNEELNTINKLLQVRLEESQKRMERTRQGSLLGQGPTNGFPNGGGSSSSESGQVGIGGSSSSGEPPLKLQMTPLPSC